jgi:hypothetical protein
MKARQSGRDHEPEYVKSTGVARTRYPSADEALLKTSLFSASWGFPEGRLSTRALSHASFAACKAWKLFFVPPLSGCTFFAIRR